MKTKITLYIGITEDGEEYAIEGNHLNDTDDLKQRIAETLGEAAPLKGFHLKTMELEVELPDNLILQGKLNLSEETIDITA